MTHDLPLEELRIHIGAHKTATTHVQDVLAANKDSLAKQGIDYLLRREVRGARLLTAMRDNYRQAELLSNGLRTFAEIVSPLRSTGPKLLVSEEDIIGMSAHLLDGLYPQAARRLLPWAEAINRETTSLFLSIRNLADILPSAYSQAVRDGANVGPIRQYINNWLHDTPKWSDLISRVREQFPKAAFKVWTLDDYICDKAKILSQMSGARHLSFLDLPIPKSTATLSLAAIEEIRRLPSDLPLPVKRQVISRIITTNSGGEPFSPLTTADRAILNERYHEDLALIYRMGVLM